MSGESSRQSNPATRRQDRRGGRGSRSNAAPTLTTAALLGVLLVAAPLACGAAHRPVLLATLGVAAMLALATTWLAARSKNNLGAAAIPGAAIALAIPMFYLIAAAVQIVPLPGGLRSVLDPKGSALLALADLHGAQALSLDPPATYAELAKAAAALCATLAAMLLARGRRLRFVAPGLVASAGLAAMAVGLGHRAAAEPLIFGRFPTSGGLLVGPFINPNHTAEFLEISAFAALAFAFSRTTAYGQRVWKILAAVLAAGAISTLSRGSVLALGAGALTWFLLAPRSDEGEPLHRGRFAATLLALLLVVGVAVGLEGDMILAEFRGGAAENLSKLFVWKDAIPMAIKHPVGIGLGSFGRVYPVYQTLRSPYWQQFLEDQPISLLIETGFVGALILLALLFLVGRQFWKEARRDRVEASLLAGLVAVVAHNFVDFGLELPGVLLPFCALLGTIFGRQTIARQDSIDPKPRRGPMVFAGLAFVGVVAAVTLLRTPTARDFDALLQPPLTPSSLATARAASIAHPLDYVYALAEARLTPDGPPRTSAQPRLRLLNRAMLLCPVCVGAHQEAARELWRLGRRQQSLLEWKMVVTGSPITLWGTLDELLKNQAKPEELATLANHENRFGISRYLLAHGMIDAARSTINKDDDRQGSQQMNAEFYLVQAQIAMAANDLATARKANQRALEIAPRAPGAILMAADLALLQPNGQDAALEIIEKGLRVARSNVDLNRKHLALLVQTDKWVAVDQALAGLRAALAESGAPTLETNIAAGQIYERRGQHRRAISEYQAALGQDPENIGLMLAVARVAEEAGNISAAIDAYSDVLRKVPTNPDARSALARIRNDKKLLEVNIISAPRTGVEGE